MRILKHIEHGLRTKFKGLRVILSWQIENMLGVLLLCKISRNLIEFKPLKTSCERIFFLNKNRFSEEMFQFQLHVPWELYAN